MKWIYEPHPDPRAVGIACCDVVNRGASLRRRQDHLQPARRAPSSPSTPRPARKCGGPRSATSTAARRSPRRRSSSRITCSSATPAASSACAATSRRSTSRPARSCGAPSTPDPTATSRSAPAFTRSTRRIRARISASRSWPAEQWKLGGSTVWGWISYDPETNLFFYGTGNPGVWNPDLRPGDNKWSCSIIARDADTGEARWAYQVDRARLLGLRRDHGEHARRHGLRRAAAQAAGPSRPHRLRLRARSRDRRAAVRGNSSSRRTGRAATT